MKHLVLKYKYDICIWVTSILLMIVSDKEVRGFKFNICNIGSAYITYILFMSLMFIISYGMNSMFKSDKKRIDKINLYKCFIKNSLILSIIIGILYILFWINSIVIVGFKEISIIGLTIYLLYKKSLFIELSK
ncbi:MAG: hypothetical protein RSB41_03680 [Bacilli bacterium]